MTKRQKTETQREFNIVTSGQFCTLAVIVCFMRCVICADIFVAIRTTVVTLWRWAD